MTFRVVTDSYSLCLNKAAYLWHTQGQRFVSFSPLCNPTCRLHVKRSVGYRDGSHNWKLLHGQEAKVRGICRYRTSSLRHKMFLITSISSFNTSACLGCADLKHRVSRLKSTLKSVSSAVSRTQMDIFSRLKWHKPSGSQETGPREANSASYKDQRNGSALAATPTRVPQPSSSSVSSTTCTTTRTTTGFPEISSTTARHIQDQREAKSKISEGHSARMSGPDTTMSSITRPGVPVSLSKSSKSSKPTTPLFHPGSFGVSLDETYNYLAQHINAYFSNFTKTEENKKEVQTCTDQPPPSLPGQSHPNSEHMPVHEPVKEPVSSAPLSGPDPPSCSKKSLGHYLASSAPTVQAFVGNYLVPLVPKFKTEPKSGPPEADKPVPNEDSKQKESAEIKEQRAAEEKARRLMLQREKIIARVSVDNRTRALVQALHRATDVRLYISRVEELSCHLLEFPETRLVAVKEKVIPSLLRLRQASDPSLKGAVREALALVGYVDPVKNRGIRILSIDGGGTRGLVALQTLQKLEELSGKSVYQLFDYICGVSTGAILAFMLGVYRTPLNECEELYRKLGSDIFKQNVIVGTVKMGWSHAFYDTEVWETVLKEKLGSDLMVETSRNPDCPKVAAVSTVVNKGPPLKAYVFRNYSLPPGVRSHYPGSCRHKVWEAVRASTAAPGYFQEFTLGTNLHQDGGLLINNPTALAIHECQCLWPETPLQCVVSLGTGRSEAPLKTTSTYTSLKTKLTNVISSATDTEEVHTMLDALLPPHTYFRFNPYVPEDVALDERRGERLTWLQAQGQRYLERNHQKLTRAVRTLTRDKSATQSLLQWLRLRMHMYGGL
ncbi:calcium-independent phospholipase A2-gamma isoform X2 [Brachyhypopomus gauderio]|uniref:calcium-independent phospholipase A2-gamma isoform X2 n=1 Tax=Brachyhypopomus gauderio TaxID=698409 RepID=UPI0040429123